MKTAEISEVQARQMYESNIPSLILIAENTYPELFKKQIEWENFGKLQGCYVTTSSFIDLCSTTSKRSIEANFTNKNAFPTRVEAEACLALSQLCQWRDKYNQGWKPDWTSSIQKYAIYFLNDEMVTDWLTNKQCVLAFKTEAIRSKFLEDFRNLIETAKPLL